MFDSGESTDKILDLASELNILGYFQYPQDKEERLAFRYDMDGRGKRLYAEHDDKIYLVDINVRTSEALTEQEMQGLQASLEKSKKERSSDRAKARAVNLENKQRIESDEAALRQERAEQESKLVTGELQEIMEMLKKSDPEFQKSMEYEQLGVYWSKDGLLEEVEFVVGGKKYRIKEEEGGKSTVKYVDKQGREHALDGDVYNVAMDDRTAEEKPDIFTRVTRIRRSVQVLSLSRQVIKAYESLREGPFGDEKYNVIKSKTPRDGGSIRFEFDLPSKHQPSGQKDSFELFDPAISPQDPVIRDSEGKVKSVFDVVRTLSSTLSALNDASKELELRAIRQRGLSEQIIKLCRDAKKQGFEDFAKEYKEGDGQISFSGTVSDEKVTFTLFDDGRLPLINGEISIGNKEVFEEYFKIFVDQFTKLSKFNPLIPKDGGFHTPWAGTEAGGRQSRLRPSDVPDPSPIASTASTSPPRFSLAAKKNKGPVPQPPAVEEERFSPPAKPAARPQIPPFDELTMEEWAAQKQMRREQEAAESAITLDDIDVRQYVSAMQKGEIAYIMSDDSMEVKFTQNGQEEIIECSLGELEGLEGQITALATIMDMFEKYDIPEFPYVPSGKEDAFMISVENGKFTILDENDQKITLKEFVYTNGVDLGNVVDQIQQVAQNFAPQLQQREEIPKKVEEQLKKAQELIVKMAGSGLILPDEDGVFELESDEYEEPIRFCITEDLQVKAIDDSNVIISDQDIQDDLFEALFNYAVKKIEGGCPDLVANYRGEYDLMDDDEINIADYLEIANEYSSKVKEAAESLFIGDKESEAFYDFFQSFLEEIEENQQEDSSLTHEQALEVTQLKIELQRAQEHRAELEAQMVQAELEAQMNNSRRQEDEGFETDSRSTSPADSVASADSGRGSSDRLNHALLSIFEPLKDSSSTDDSFRKTSAPAKRSAAAPRLTEDPEGNRTVSFDNKVLGRAAMFERLAAAQATPGAEVRQGEEGEFEIKYKQEKHALPVPSSSPQVGANTTTRLDDQPIISAGVNKA